MANYEYRTYSSDWREEEYLEFIGGSDEKSLIDDLWWLVLSFIFFLIILSFIWISKLDSRKSVISIVIISIIYLSIMILSLVKDYNSILYSWIEDNTFWIVNFLDSLNIIENSQGLPFILFMILFFWYYGIVILVAIFFILKDYIEKIKK